MEKGSNRILGYQLASNPQNEDLGKVNGGSQVNNTCFKRSFHLSGSAMNNVDAMYDITVDR